VALALWRACLKRFAGIIPRQALEFNIGSAKIIRQKAIPANLGGSGSAAMKGGSELNIIVCMKQVVDLQQIRIKRETREPVLDGLPVLFGDMDKNALEEAVRIKEEHGAKVTVVSIGSPKLKETILEPLAMGADDAFIVVDPLCEGSDTAASALTLATAITKIGPYDLILVGEGSADNYSGQIGSRLAEVLDVPQITYVRELHIQENTVTAVRDMENALETVKAAPPMIISVTSEINKPRRAPLTQILRASRKPLNLWTLKDLDISPEKVGVSSSQIQVVKNLAPEQERKGIIFEGDVEKSVNELVGALRKEGALQ
jgi:electron transfer flavoprotein beta subunit